MRILHGFILALIEIRIYTVHLLSLIQGRHLVLKIIIVQFRYSSQLKLI